MLNRPFFLLLYCILRKEQSFVFSNEIDIINTFIEKSIGKHVLHSSDKDIICRFATQAINNNLISVHETEIESDIDKNVLLRSIRMSWKVAISAITLTLIKLFS